MSTESTVGYGAPASVEPMPSPGQAGVSHRGVRRVLSLGPSVLFLATLVLVWWLVTTFGHVAAYILPKPSAVASAFYTQGSSLLKYTESTVVETVVGFAMAAAAGILLAGAIAASRLVKQLIYPSLVASQSIPKIAIAPLLIGWLGLGILPKFLLAALTAIFPIVISSAAGFENLDPDIARLARASGASTAMTFVHVRLPAAATYIFSGLKVGITFSLIGAIVGEFIGGNIGLGYYISSVTGSLQMDYAFAALAILALVGVLCYGAIAGLEWVLCPWRR